MADESWAWYGLKFTTKVGAKVALNACLPGSGSAVDFGLAVKCFYEGDTSGAVLNTVSGLADFATFGIAGSVKEAMKESAKAAVKQTAKETAKSAGKQATKKVGQHFAKQLAKGAIEGGKDAAIQTAKETAKAASKEATKQVGKKVGKEIAKGVITTTVEEVWHEGTKATVNEMRHNAMLIATSIGGNQVMKAAMEDLAEEGLTSVFSEALKQGTKTGAFEVTKDAAKTGAKEALVKNSRKVLATQVIGGAVDIINFLENRNKDHPDVP